MENKKGKLKVSIEIDGQEYQTEITRSLHESVIEVDQNFHISSIQHNLKTEQIIQLIQLLTGSDEVIVIGIKEDKMMYSSSDLTVERIIGLIEITKHNILR